MNKPPNSGHDDELIAVTGLIETTLIDLGNARLMILNSLAKLDSAFRYRKVKEHLGINKFFEFTQAHNKAIALTSYIMPDIAELVKRLYKFGDSLNQEANRQHEMSDEDYHPPESGVSDNLTEQINNLMKGSMDYVQQQVNNLETNKNDEQPSEEQDSEEAPEKETPEEDQDGSGDQN